MKDMEMVLTTHSPQPPPSHLKTRTNTHSPLPYIRELFPLSQDLTDISKPTLSAYYSHHIPINHLHPIQNPKQIPSLHFAIPGTCSDFQRTIWSQSTNSTEMLPTIPPSQPPPPHPRPQTNTQFSLPHTRKLFALPQDLIDTTKQIISRCFSHHIPTNHHTPP